MPSYRILAYTVGSKLFPIYYVHDCIVTYEAGFATIDRAHCKCQVIPVSSERYAVGRHPTADTRQFYRVSHKTRQYEIKGCNDYVHECPFSFTGSKHAYRSLRVNFTLRFFFDWRSHHAPKIDLSYDSSYVGVIDLLTSVFHVGHIYV